MLDLKIQATKEPAFDCTASSEVHGGFDLMDRPGIFHRAGILVRHWEVGLFNAMSQLKDNANDHSGKTGYQNVEQEHHPEGMDQKRQAKSQCEEQRFTADKSDKFPPFRPRHACESDPAKDHISEIIVEIPLDDIQSVEWPQIEMLPAMKFESSLMWR